MATNKKTVKISFQEAHEVVKNQNLNEKRMLDQGGSDKEIVEEILLHYGVELININNENMEPEKLVSSIEYLVFSWF